MNTQTFDTTKPNGKKQFNQLLDALLAYNADEDNDDYNDIHIKQEEVFLVLEWEKVPYNYNEEWGGHFEYIKSDEVIMKEVYFPDGHYEYVFPDDVEITKQRWHEEHPEWVKTDYGTWTNIEENRKSSIDFFLEEWCNQNVTANDSIFQKHKGEYHETPSLEQLFSIIPSDVLYRTSYVVVSPDLVKQFKPQERISKVKEQEITFTYKNFDKEETITTKVPIYTVTDWPDELFGDMLFITDMNYLIYREVIDYLTCHRPEKS